MLIKTLKFVFGISAVLICVPLVYVFFVGSIFDPNTLPHNYGKVNSVLYAQEGKTQPLLVYFGGSEGGNSMAKPGEQKVRELYTNEGYAMLALGYFGLDGLPKELDRISLDSIHKEIKRTQELDNIDNSCVAVLGGSKGAELALSLASKFTDINAVVSFAGSHVVFSSISIAADGRTASFSYNDKSLPYVNVPFKAIPHMLMGDFRTAHEIALHDDQAVAKAAIKVENIHGPVLLISGELDHVWPSAEMSTHIINRLKAHHFPYTYEHIKVPGGDHFQPQNDYHQQSIDFLNQHFRSQCDAANQNASLRA